MDRAREMEVFRRVVEAGGLSSAARSLGMGQPNVSRLIAELEARLGTPLLHRSPRGLHPTEAGQVFYEESGKALAALEAAEEAVRGEKADVRGVLRIGSPALIFRSMVMPWLLDVLRQHPALSIEVLVRDAPVDLLAEGLDVAIRTGQPRQDSLMSRHIGRFGLSLYAAPSYLAERGRPREPADLAAHEICAFRSLAGSIRLQDDSGRQADVPIHGRIRADDVATLQEAAEAGFGLVLLPPWRVPVSIESGLLEPVLPNWHAEPRDLYVVWPATRHMPRRLRLFIDLLAARCAADPRLSLRG